MFSFILLFSSKMLQLEVFNYASLLNSVDVVEYNKQPSNYANTGSHKDPGLRFLNLLTSYCYSGTPILRIPFVTSETTSIKNK